MQLASLDHQGKYYSIGAPTQNSWLSDAQNQKQASTRIAQAQPEATMQEFRQWQLNTAPTLAPRPRQQRYSCRVDGFKAVQMLGMPSLGCAAKRALPLRLMDLFKPKAAAIPEVCKEQPAGQTYVSPSPGK